MSSPLDPFEIFAIGSDQEFNEFALEMFHHQAVHNQVYRRYLDILSVDHRNIKDLQSIPFLPVEIFKTHRVVTTGYEKDFEEQYFESSSTTGKGVSRHFFWDPYWYWRASAENFSNFFGDEHLDIVALLPGYMEREHSSLIYMVRELMEIHNTNTEAFFLNDYEGLLRQVEENREWDQRTLIFGVAHALVDFAQWLPEPIPDLIILETGGMKGRKREMTREELHEFLKARFGVDVIYSEYGMTELFSQAYSGADGIFDCPNWMKVFIRDSEDPFNLLPHGRTGGINVIDLANAQSCAFIATSDLGRSYEDDRFEVLGRFDHSDIRGCSLMVA
ncbi:MAG: acyl transferase [Flavobacteriales bacterium]|nr:acyl transferase [Flavobacteriales bacterium]